jgi:hypothetical protein
LNTDTWNSGMCALPLLVVVGSTVGLEWNRSLRLSCHGQMLCHCFVKVVTDYGYVALHSIHLETHSFVGCVLTRN